MGYYDDTPIGRMNKKVKDRERVRKDRSEVLREHSDMKERERWEEPSLDKMLRVRKDIPPEPMSESNFYLAMVFLLLVPVGILFMLFNVDDLPSMYSLIGSIVIILFLIIMFLCDIEHRSSKKKYNDYLNKLESDKEG